MYVCYMKKLWITEERGRNRKYETLCVVARGIGGGGGGGGRWKGASKKSKPKMMESNTGGMNERLKTEVILRLCGDRH